MSLLQKINQENCLAVQTHGGISQRKVVEKIICQGDPWGPIEYSIQLDEIGKESLQKDLEPYKYKGLVEMPALGWIGGNCKCVNYKCANLKDVKT